MSIFNLFNNPKCKACNRVIPKKYYSGDLDCEIFEDAYLCDSCWYDFKHSPEYLLYKKRKLQLFIDSKLSS